jgi:hypothetical protein
VQINDALETYTGDDEEHKSFAFMHCWYKLKDEDKWNSWRLEQATRQKPATKNKQKTTKDSTPSTGDEKNNDEVVEVADAGSAERKRPPGQKQAKKARWGGNDPCIALLDKMMEKKEERDKERDKAREATVEVDKASIEVEKKFAEATLMKEEKEIMLADTSSLEPSYCSFCFHPTKLLLFLFVFKPNWCHSTCVSHKDFLLRTICYIYVCCALVLLRFHVRHILFELIGLLILCHCTCC